MDSISLFNNNLNEYENWFTKNILAYETELKAIKQIAPIPEKSIEIGVGSGLFAGPCGIKYGIDPAGNMLVKAQARGVETIRGKAEALPLADNSFEYALMVTAICFVDDPLAALAEIYRILVAKGVFVLGFVDKSSFLGKNYQKKKHKSLFYKDAKFFTLEEINVLLKKVGFEISEILQTLFDFPENLTEVQVPVKTKNKGGFTVIKAQSRFKK
ncbi:MAG: class I SAM-dependent methyltransferase [Deltaproteobacteria bacterium]|jgi:ubiquinone/menaquinone biosynthesis C-methylase UbiE|nr:class I SAM-dependent methyltransferase [Deltaproteobacteria bacterium]